MAHHAILLPDLIREKLSGHRCNRLVEDLLAGFGDWIARNETVFFRDYTDHGPRHIESVMETACALMSPASVEAFSAEDACLLTCSTVLHDCALHLQESGFLTLVTGEETSPIHLELDSDAWAILWRRYVSETGRLSQSQLRSMFGVEEPIPAPILAEPGRWTSDQFSLIGEFLRRHHHRLAHEIATNGIPGASGESPFDRIDPDDPLRGFIGLSGLVARSHGTSIRSLLDYLEKQYHLRKHENSHPVFIMVLLRVADYLQIQRDRAPAGTRRVKSLRSPISRREWGVHHAIKDILYDQHNDPETVEISVDPTRTPIEIFLRIRDWLNGIQSELDTSWAVLGEVYGRFAERNLGLIIRRVRSNIDREIEFGRQAGYVPQKVAFSAADAELLKLLIKPLYGDRPEIAVRELVQNAVDAVRERSAVEKGAPIGRVDVTIRANDDATYSLIVDDTGVGMTFETLANYFLNAGASFRNSMSWKQQFLDSKGKSAVLRSGRFGVGALAAFLVADDPSDVLIRATTRHCLAAPDSAHSFEAPLTDRPIAIRHSRREKPGTTIEVVTRSPPVFMKETGSDRSSGSKWDWYCLERPMVRRVALDGKELKQRIKLPAQLSIARNDYHWIDPDRYAGVGWTYAEDAVPLVCNGITVLSSAHLPTRGLPVLEKASVPAGELEIVMPSISVFDPDGRLPLTLDRLRVDFERISFLDELRADVIKNLVAYLVVCAPSGLHKPDQLNRVAPHKLATHPAIKESVKRIPWLHTKKGLTVYDPELATDLGLTHLLEFSVFQDARKLAESYPSDGVGVAVTEDSLFPIVKKKNLPAFKAARFATFADEVSEVHLRPLEQAYELARSGGSPLNKASTGLSELLKQVREELDTHLGRPWMTEEVVYLVEKSLQRIDSRSDRPEIHDELREMWNAISERTRPTGEAEARDIEVAVLLKRIANRRGKLSLSLIRDVASYVATNIDPVPRLRGPIDHVSFKERLSRACSEIDRKIDRRREGLLRRVYNALLDRIDRRRELDERAETALAILEEIADKWRPKVQIRSLGSIRNLSLDWNAVEQTSPNRGNWFVAEYELDEDGEAPSTSFFARIWKDYVRIPAIPRRLEERREELDHLWSDATFRRHLEEWEQALENPEEV